jgi:hypothetical protein
MPAIATPPPPSCRAVPELVHTGSTPEYFAYPVVAALLDDISRRHDGSAFLRSRRAFMHLRGQLTALETLETNWDSFGSEPPSASSMDSAREILKLIEDDKLIVPDRILASAEGGAAICFVANDHYAHIECPNDEGPASLVMFKAEGEPVVLDVDLRNPEEIREAMSRIRAYLQP